MVRSVLKTPRVAGQQLHQHHQQHRLSDEFHRSPSSDDVNGMNSDYYFYKQVASPFVPDNIRLSTYIMRSYCNYFNYYFDGSIISELLADVRNENST